MTAPADPLLAVAAVEAALAGMTPGEWAHEETPRSRSVKVAGKTIFSRTVNGRNEPADKRAVIDFDGIVTLRNAAPGLCAAVRALCEERALAVQGAQVPAVYYSALAAENAALVAERDDLRSNPRDEYHTMRELYEYRMLYNAHAARAWARDGLAVKSWKHSDGEPCFGGGWFVVVATLPTGQVTNHYRESDWDLFDVPEVERPPAWDGHTPEVAVARLRAALSAPQPGEGNDGT